MFVGCEQFFRPGYIANLVPSWIPALEGVREKLEAGAQGRRRRVRARRVDDPARRAVPAVDLLGCDYHDESIELARKRAAEAGVADRISFETARAQDFAGSGYDLVATFDCLHDMGDPLGAARHIRQALDDDGTWLIVEPMAGDTVADNLNPVGRVYYGFSTFLCVPNALSQSGGYSLGRPGRREGDRRGRGAGRLHPVPPGRRDAVQPRLRSPALNGEDQMTGMRTAGARGTVGPVRAREPDRSGFAVRDGVRLYYEVLGDGPTTVVLLPAWSIVHSRAWKLQVHYLARHFRVVVYDPRGNGRSDRPVIASAYDEGGLVADALAVLDTVGVDSAVVVGLSLGGRTLLHLAADHPDRVAGAMFVAPAVDMHDREPVESTFDEPRAEYVGWDKWNAHYWRADQRGFAEFFFGEVFPEAHSTRQVEEGTRWALETDADALVASQSPGRRVVSGAAARDAAARVALPRDRGARRRRPHRAPGRRACVGRRAGRSDRGGRRWRPLRPGAAPRVVQPAAPPVRRGGGQSCERVNPTGSATSTATASTSTTRCSVPDRSP